MSYGRAKEKYRIELTEEQLKLVANCLESVSRMYCAQIEPNYHTPLSDKCWNLDTEEKEKVERLFFFNKRLFVARFRNK